MEMKELMPKNAALRTQWAELGFSFSSLKLREIDDPLSWLIFSSDFSLFSLLIKQQRA